MEKSWKENNTLLKKSGKNDETNAYLDDAYGANVTITIDAPKDTVRNLVSKTHDLKILSNIVKDVLSVIKKRKGKIKVDDLHWDLDNDTYSNVIEYYDPTIFIGFHHPGVDDEDPLANQEQDLIDEIEEVLKKDYFAFVNVDAEVEV